MRHRRHSSTSPGIAMERQWSDREKVYKCEQCGKFVGKTIWLDIWRSTLTWNPTSVSTVKNVLDDAKICLYMCELTQGRNPICANIVRNILVNAVTWLSTCELTLKRHPTCVSTAASVSPPRATSPNTYVCTRPSTVSSVTRTASALPPRTTSTNTYLPIVSWSLLNGKSFCLIGFARIKPIHIVVDEYVDVQ